MSAPAPHRRFGLSEWRLGWKVFAVLAVPLIVALVFGGMQVWSQMVQARQLDAAADRVGAIPATIELDAAVGAVAAGQATATVTDVQLTELTRTVDAMQDLLGGDGPSPDTAAALRVMLDKAKVVQAGGQAAAASLTDLTATVHEEQAQAVRAVQTAAAGIGDDAAADADRTTLVDALALRHALFESAVTGLELVRDPKLPLDRALAATGAERAALGRLAADLAVGDPVIDGLSHQVDDRAELLSQGRTTRAYPGQELQDSTRASLDTINSVVDRSAQAITSDVDSRATAAGHGTLRDLGLVVFLLLVAGVLAALVARSLVQPLRRLRDAARELAERDLPGAVERIKVGENVDNIVQQPMPVYTHEEVGQVARAVDDIHDQTLRLAAEQANLRLQVNDMFETLARRSKSLVDHQLGLIEAMEFEEKDPKLLDRLFRLDHLAARMRRNGDNLLILAGTRVRRTKTAPVEIGDVLRAAISEVEDYQRVKLNATPRGLLIEPAATDIAHLIAELLDNALRASPPETDVRFSFAQANDQGLLVDVADRGIGIPPDEMQRINAKLATAAEVGPDTARQMGLFVVSRLADRHGVGVRMRQTFATARDPGVTVTVHIPRRLIIPPGTVQGQAGPGGGARHTGPQHVVPAPQPDHAPAPQPPPPPQQQPPAPQQPPARPEQPLYPGGATRPAPALPPAAGRPSGTPALAPTAVARASNGNLVVTMGADRDSPRGAPGAPGGSGAPRERTAAGLPKRVPGGTIEIPPTAPTPMFEEPEPSGPMPALPPTGPMPALPATGPMPALPATGPMPALPASGPLPVVPVAGEVVGPPEEQGRHRHRADTVRTASFFRSRLKPPPGGFRRDDPPIFADMMSAWLSDPDAESSSGSRGFDSAADEGWRAAEYASEAVVNERTASGLPQRTPGQRLVPGTASGDRTAAVRRRPDPEAIRNTLSRHQRGVREGRAYNAQQAHGRTGKHDRGEA